MRARGDGCIFQRPDSRYWWVKYSRNGKPFRQSTEFLVDCGNAKQNATARRNAENLLKQKLAELRTGTFVAPSVERIRVSELADDFVRDYKINGKRSLYHAEFRWRIHLEPFFGHLRAADVTSTDVDRYVDARQQAGASNSTINRELAALRRMFRLGQQATPPKVQRIPHFRKLTESAPRTGTLGDAEYLKLADACNAAWLAGMLEVGFTYGWRSGGLKQMRVSQVDLFNCKMHLTAQQSKNGRPVTAYFAKDGAVYQALVRCVRGKNTEDFLFARDGKDGKHRASNPSVERGTT